MLACAMAVMRWYHHFWFVRADAQVPEDDPMRHDVQAVPLRAGSIVIWSSALPHGTFPNDSARGRMIQYVKMVRVDDPSGLKPVFTDERLLPPSVTLTPLGRKLHGFEAWEADPSERPMAVMPVATGSDVETDATITHSDAGASADAGAGAAAAASAIAHPRVA